MKKKYQYTYTLRLEEEQIKALKKLSDANGKTISHILRELIGFGLRHINKPLIDRVEKTNLQGGFEMLALMRGLCDKIDPTLRTQAESLAKQAMENFEVMP